MPGDLLSVPVTGTHIIQLEASAIEQAAVYFGVAVDRIGRDAIEATARMTTNIEGRGERTVLWEATVDCWVKGEADR